MKKQCVSLVNCMALGLETRGWPPSDPLRVTCGSRQELYLVPPSVSQRGNCDKGMENNYSFG